MTPRQTADAGVKDYYEKQVEGAYVISEQSQGEMNHNQKLNAAILRVEARLNGKKISAKKLAALVAAEMN